MKYTAFIFTLFLLFTNIAYSAKFLSCPPVDAAGKLRIDTQARTILEKCIKQTPSTKSLYFDSKTQQYTAERQALHNKIIKDILANKPCISKAPIAILTGGLPGSGKTTYLKKYFPSALAKQFISIDADAIREKLPEYKGWNAANTQPEVKDIINGVLKQIAVPCKHNLLYDSSMSNAAFFNGFIRNLKKKGYQVYIFYIQIPVDIATQRTYKRYQQSKRYVSKEFIQHATNQSKSTFNHIRKKADGYIVIDGQTGKIIEKGGKAIPKQNS